MWKKWLAFLLLWTAPCLAKYQYQLSICMLFRDEAPYLKEWIEFHRLVGVEHFYLCSDNSEDNYLEVLTPYIEKGIVELKELTTDKNEDLADFNSRQASFYTECLDKARNVSQWVAFIDSDEFLFPTQEKSLIEFLKNYEEFGGVTANWQMFGTSKVHLLESNELMIERLVRCAAKDFEGHKTIKSIVQPVYTVFFYNAHYAQYIGGYNQVNTDKESFYGAISPYIQVDQLRINHYWTRDEYYFWNYKVPRQVKWCNLTPQHFMHVPDQFNQESDFTIQRFVPKLKKRMNLKS